MGLVRLLLAIAVLLAHLPAATVKFIHGGTAVQAFFVISGLYMALILDGKYREASLFYSNRLLRLAPAYFAMLLIALVALLGFGLTATATPEIHADLFSNPISAAILVIENILVIGQHGLYWFKIDDQGGLYFDPYGGLPTETNAVGWQALLVPQSWSLSIELMFYAVAPWLAGRKVWVIGLIALASIGLRFAGMWLPLEFPLWQGRLFITALFMFLFGMLAYRAFPFIERLPRWSHYTGVAGLVAMVCFLPQTGMAPQLPYPSWSAIVITLLVSAAILQFIERPVDRWRQARVRSAGLPHDQALDQQARLAAAS